MLWGGRRDAKPRVWATGVNELFKEQYVQNDRQMDFGDR